MILRVFIVEDDDGTRSALCAALSAHAVTVCGAFATAEEALAALDDVRAPGVVALVDLGLPGMGGIEAIRALKNTAPDLAVLVHTVFEDPARVVDAIRAGASGYLLKGAPIGEVRAALAQVRDGLAPVSPAVARHLLTAVRASGAASARSSLTDRELEVLDLLVRGHSYASVALALGIGVGTVQTHVKSVYRKLEVASKAEAAAAALRMGLIS